MKLQRVFLLLSGALAVIGIAMGITLIALTTALQKTSSAIESAVESVSIAEELEIELLSYGIRDSVARVAHEEHLVSLARAAAAHAESREEVELIARLDEQVRRYVSAVREAVGTEPTLAAVRDKTRAEFDAAFALARRLIQMNVEESRARGELITRWSRRADVVGAAAIALLIAGLGFCAYWVRSVALRPALALARAIESYARGERSSRAAVAGAAEFRTIAQRFNEMAEIQERQRQQQLAFLGGVAHDIRNPLSALKLATSVISPDRPLPAEDRIRQSFARVQRQLDRLERLVHDFLDAARVESGSLELQFEEHDVCELARAVVDLFASTTPVHRLELSAPGTPVRVVCDRLRIEQVLENLVSNGIKYSPRGGTLRIGVDAVQGGVRLAVSDDGIGIPASEMGSLFEPFRRATSSKHSIPGVGLGLFVARKIVEAHGGRIEVQSKAGAGSTFAVWLPIRQACDGAMLDGGRAGLLPAATHPEQPALGLEGEPAASSGNRPSG